MKTSFVDVNDQADNAQAPKLSSKSLGKMVWGLVKPYKKWLLIIFIAMLVETGMGLAAPWPLKIIIDNVLGHHKFTGPIRWMDYVFGDTTNMKLAMVAAIGVVLIAAVGSFAGYLENYYTESVAQFVAKDLRQRIYHHLQRLALTYYDTHQTGKLLSTITSDVSTIQDFAASTLMNIFVDLLTIFGMLGLMLYINPAFTLIAVCITPFLLFFVMRFKKVMKKATHEVRKDQSNMLAVLQQGLESIRAVNAFGRQQLEEDRLEKVSLETVTAALKARRVKSVLSPVVTIMVSVCSALVLWQGANLLLTGVMTVGTLTVFIWYLNRFFAPVQDLAKMTSTIAQATVALERIQSILDTNLIIHQKPTAIDPGRLTGNIVFENIHFSYEAGNPVLNDINLKIKCGQRIGICGPTGCGKSTVVSLIARFYDPTGGRVLIDGQDITDFTLDGLRAQVGFVLQDTVLFYGSIRDNIAYGRSNATKEEIIQAAKLANAHEFISKMPHGYDTLVGERGVTLSGGQRQRIGIARAVVRNSPILILDEPTAALDAEAEELVMDALEQLMEGRTVITIAHRLCTIYDADKIFVLQDGRVAEEGTHEELVAQRGIYSDLYQLQSAPVHALHKMVV